MILNDLNRSCNVLFGNVTHGSAALSDEITEIEQACTALVQTVFSADAITAAMSEPYSETAVIGGHTAELTLSVNMTDMTMEVSFIYMP